MKRDQLFIQSLGRISHRDGEDSLPGEKCGLACCVLLVVYCGMLFPNAWASNPSDHISDNFRILGREHLFDSKRLTHYINLIGKALVFHSNRNDLEYHFAVLDNNRANAYSTPGGYIFITKGAIEYLKPVTKPQRNLKPTELQRCYLRKQVMTQLPSIVIYTAYTKNKVRPNFPQPHTLHRPSDLRNSVR